MGRIILKSLADTAAFAKQVAAEAAPNDIFALKGDLGAGKTTFVRYLCNALGFQGTVQSPTFVFLNQYPTSLPVFHFDLYRMKSGEDFFALGFEEYFTKEGICTIEWPQCISNRLPPHTRLIEFQHISATERLAFIRPLS